MLKVHSMTEEKTSSDNRAYRTVYFQEAQEAGVLSNRKPSGRNIWEEGPNGSAGDAIYPNLNVGVKVKGSIQTIEVEEYFIPSEYGKFQDEQGRPANKATTFTSVVFEGENIATLARQAGHTLAGEAEAAALDSRQEETINEDLAVEA